jgi:hypothetical protein
LQGPFFKNKKWTFLFSSRVVASCPKLELLCVENDDDSISTRGIRAIADGLPNLVALFFEGLGRVNDTSYENLLTKKPGLAALELNYGICDQYAPLLRTAMQISRMVDLQHLQVYPVPDSRMMRNLFWYANFAQLKTLLLRSDGEFNSADLKAMALACPNVERLELGYILHFSFFFILISILALVLPRSLGAGLNKRMRRPLGVHQRVDGQIKGEQDH